MADETQETKSGNLSALTAALNRVADVAETIQSTKGASQTSDAAIRQAVNESREAYKGAETETEKAAQDARLAEKLAAYEAELKELKDKNHQRKSEYSLRDAKEYLADKAGVNVKAAFSKLQAKAARSEDYAKWSDGRPPMDMLIRGALEPAIAKFSAGGKSTGFENYQPFTVGSEDEVLADLQKWNDAVFIWGKNKQALEGGNAPAWHECPFFHKLQSAYQTFTKALDTTDTGNFIPTGMSSALIERYELERNLTKYVRTFQMPRNPWDMPYSSTRPSMKLHTENTADPESATAVTVSDPVDAKTTLNLVDLAVRTSWSKTLEEDMIVSVLDWTRSEFAKAWTYGEEDAILNGDTAGTHMDSDVTAATDIRKAWLGLRAHAVDQSYTTDLNSTHTSVGLAGMISSMGVYGVRASELVFVVGVKERAKLLNLLDANSNNMILGNAVAAATPAAVTTDMVPTLYSIPIVTSEAARENLNTSGVYDGTTTDNQGIVLFNRQGFVYAYTNQAPMFYVDDNIRTLQTEMVMHVRREFEDVYAIASHHTVHYGINIDN